MIPARAHRAVPDVPAKKPASSQKGNALVEFAFVLPLFLFLVFGMITFSLALYDKIILTMATREGARAGALDSHDSENTAKTAAENFTKNAADPSKNILISFTDSTPTFIANKSGNDIVVQGTYLYTGLPSPFWNLLLPATINLTAQNTMRIESP